MGWWSTLFGSKPKDDEAASAKAVRWFRVRAYSYDYQHLVRLSPLVWSEFVGKRKQYYVEVGYFAEGDLKQADRLIAELKNKGCFKVRLISAD
jgi:hypothetical protein